MATKFSDHVLLDGDSVPVKYQTKLDSPGVVSFKEGDVVISSSKLSTTGQNVSFKTPERKFSFKTKFIASHNLPALALAYLVGLILDVDEADMKSILEDLEPFPGRMQVIKGVKGSLIIDDTYNSSPEAAIAALGTLYGLKAEHKIAILGQMNEMGDFSQGYHEEVGRYCDPKQLDLVATIGKDANQYLAKEAEAKGCKVLKFETPYHAGEIIASMLKKDTIVLIKGSQNGVFAEETVKLLLENPEDQSKLVRQSEGWLKTKRDCFKGKV
nr:Mur ligase family, glutamate ligase domain protein [uncultured bacterium]